MSLEKVIKYDCSTGEMVETLEEMTLPEPRIEEKQPAVEDYLLDYEFRISMLELGGTV